MSQVPRLTFISAIAGAENGGSIWQPSQMYYKATAFHIVPSPDHPDQLISIDGEHLSARDGPFTVECLKGAGRTLALRGRWEGGDDFWKKGFLKTEEDKL